MLYLPFYFQELLLKRIEKAIVDCNTIEFHGENLVIEKCREMAASWSVLTVFLHRWLFFGDSFLLMSRKEELVDRAGDMNCLFEKLRFMLRRLPEFFLPHGFNWRIHSKNMLLINPIGGEIVGEATTSSTGRAGRVNGILYDELAFVDIGVDFAAWGGASMTTPCRIAVSTVNGPHNLFAKLATDPKWEEEREVITLPWYIHPVKGQGLEVIGGKFTSPWYRATKKRINPQVFARDVEIDYRTSTKGVVYEQYGDVHYDDELEAVKGCPVIVCMDPGTHWYTGWFQIDEYERLLCLREYYSENDPRGIDGIADSIEKINNQYFNKFDLEFCGDPAGANVNSSMHRGKSEWVYMWEKKRWIVHYDFMNRITPADWMMTRIRAVQQRMTRLTSIGPGFVINTKNMPILHAALAGNYRWKTNPDGGIEEKPEHIHPHCDAADVLGYVPLYRDMYQQNADTELKVGKNRVVWGDPSGGRNWAS